MKKNTWVFYFFIFIFTVVLSAHLIWKLTPIKAEIRQTLEDRLRPHLGESFNVEDFTLGFGYISFHDITAGGIDENYQLQLKEIQIGYSLHKLLVNKLDPLQVIETITFKNPHLILLTGSSDSAKTETEKSLDATEMLLGFKKFAEIDRVFIKDGQILWGDSLTKVTKFVSDLEGYLFVKEEMQAFLNLNGKLFSSTKKDMSLKGTINLIEKNWSILSTINQSQLQNGLPFLDDDNFSIQDAVIDGELEMNCPSFNVNDVSIDGNLLVENMKASLFDQQMNTNNFYIEFDKHKMVLTSVAGKVEDGNFIISGNLGSVFDPGLYISVDFEDFSAKNISISAPILEDLNQGKLQGHLDINGPKSDIVIEGNIYSSQLYYNIAPFYRASLDFTFKDKIWTFHEIQTKSIGLNHRGKGEIDFNKMKMTLDIFSEKQLGSGVFPILNKLNNTQMQYFTHIDGDFPTLTFTGTINNLFQSQQDTVLSARSTFKLVEDNIVLQSTHSFPEKMELQAEIVNLWEDPNFKILEVKNVPFDSLSSLGAVHWLASKFKSNLYFSGPVNYPTAKIKFINRFSDNIFFAFSGSAVNLIQPGLKFKGNFSFQTSPQKIHGNLFLEDQKDRLMLRLDCPDVVEANLDIGYENTDPIKGHIQLNKIDINKFIGGFPEIQKTFSEGSLNGYVNMTGTTGNPNIQFDVGGTNFIINQNGYYSAKFKGNYSTEKFSFDEARIDYNNRPIFEAEFDWNMTKDSLTATFKGQQIESNFLATTLFNNPNLIQGKLQYDISMNGNSDRPQILGTIILRDGIFGSRTFNTLNIIFEDSIPNSADLFQIKEHIFKIHKFIYVDRKDYTIEAEGTLPVNSKSPIDVNMNVKGNILAELPDIIDYFQKPNCLGEMFLHIRGTRENPQLSAGNLNFYTGTLEFESVLPPIRELRADVKLVEENRFIHIQNLEGKLGGQWVRIHNQPADSLSHEKLKDWKFEEFGLNLGVFILETDPQGIPLSIPGMMNPGDLGFFAASGKEEGEKFYFSGPFDRPYARGKVTLFESRVTFPFLEVEGEEVEEDSRVVEFLMNVDWDILAIPDVGNRYFVDIPAVIGKVYLDLNIDNVSEGLEFTGRLIDESFRVEGRVESTRGRVEYLDMNFRVDRFGAVFSEYELFPEVYGRAYTTVRDSTNFPKDIYLELYAIDPETKQEVSRGRWEDFRFKLVSSDPTIGETQENVLSYLGYSVDNLPNKAGDVGLTLTENYIFRPLVRPLERKLERGLGLDYVRLKSSFASNLIHFGFQNRFKFLGEPSYYSQNLNNNFDPALLLLQSSEITLGKYLLKDVYLSYSGQLVSVYDESKLGLNHQVGLEYRIMRNLLLEFEYDKFQFNPRFYSRDALNDFRIRLRHSFNF